MESYQLLSATLEFAITFHANRRHARTEIQCRTKVSEAFESSPFCFVIMIP